jgi:hypothetical protein
MLWVAIQGNNHPMNTQKTRDIGAHSRPHRLAKLDGRTREAKRLREITRDLTNHVGGAAQVSAAQRYLIQRTAIDILRLELLDADMATGRISDHSARIAHALRNSVRLALRDLKPTAPPTETLQDYLRRTANGAAEAAA